MKGSQRPITLPKHIWDKLSPEDQRAYQACFQTDEDREHWHQNREKEMHNQLESWLRRHGFQYIHARMDKPTGIGVGVFDFMVWNAGLVCFVEFKTDKGRLSQGQKDFLAAQIADRTPAMVAHSYEDAVAFVTHALALG